MESEQEVRAQRTSRNCLAPGWIICREAMSTEKGFLTPSTFKEQLGLVAYRAGVMIEEHPCVRLERNVVVTSAGFVRPTARRLIEAHEGDWNPVAGRAIKTSGSSRWSGATTTFGCSTPRGFCFYSGLSLTDEHSDQVCTAVPEALK